MASATAQPDDPRPPPPGDDVDFAVAAVSALPLVSALAVDTELRYREVIGSDVVKHGYDPRALIGQRVRDVVPAETWAEVEPMFRTALAGQACTHVIGTDLPHGWYEATYSPIHDPDGVVIGCLTTVRDVTVETTARQELERVRAQHEVLATHGSDVIVLLDRDGAVTYTSPSLERILGWAPADVRGMRIRTLIHRADLLGETPAREVLASGVDEVTRHNRMRCADGSLRWVEARIRAVRADDGQLVSMVANIRDISDRMELVEELSRTSRLLEQVFEASPIGSGLLTPDGAWVRVNRALIELTGMTQADLLAGAALQLLDAEDARHASAAFARLVRGEVAREELEARVVAPSGSVRWIQVWLSSVADEDGRIDHVVLKVEDQTARVLERDRLQDEASTDPLTGLSNRRRLDAALESAIGAEGPSTLVHLDLDRFKTLNDQHGHDAGDAHLRTVAVLLRSMARDGDVIARLGGDEFAVLLHGAGTAEAATVADRIVAGVEALDGGTGASVGVAEHRPGEGASEWLRRADLAMYEAKRAGGGRLVAADGR